MKKVLIILAVAIAALVIVKSPSRPPSNLPWQTDLPRAQTQCACRSEKTERQQGTQDWSTLRNQLRMGIPGERRPRNLQRVKNDTGNGATTEPSHGDVAKLMNHHETQPRQGNE